MFLFSSKKQNFFSEIDVRQVLLSKYIATHDIKKIDFIKIDTEGYEYYVLKGLKNHFQKIKIILSEKEPVATSTSSSSTTERFASYSAIKLLPSFINWRE